MKTFTIQWHLERMKIFMDRKPLVTKTLRDHLDAHRQNVLKSDDAKK